MTTSTKKSPATAKKARTRKAATGATSAAKGKAATTGAAPVEKPARAATSGDTAKGGPDLDALRKTATDAQAELDAAEKEARAQEDAARLLRVKAKAAFRDAVAPYRDACRKAGVPCEFAGGRAENVSERVSFQVEKMGNGLKIVIRDRPETEEVIPLAKVKASIGKAAYAYTDKHLGPREEVGNKGGSLANRLRSALKGGGK